MSMHFHDVNHSTSAADRPDYDQYLFGNSVQARRQELGLSLFEAAELSGLTLFQWAAVEDGAWVPESQNVIRAMAGALEASGMQMILLASLSAWAMGGYKTKHPKL